MNLIICPSHHQRELLVRLFGHQNKFIALHYGVKPCLNHANKKTSSKPTFGYLGSLWKAKGITFIEKAAELLKENDFNIFMGIQCFTLTSSETAYLEKLKQNTKIKIKLNIEYNKIYEDFFSKIDYLIIPSIWNETGPMTLFESFNYKVPVIIFNTPSLIEKIKDNKSSFFFNDVTELARIMKDIIENNIDKYPQDNFLVKHIVEYASEIDDIYKNALKKNSRGLFLRLGHKCNSQCVFCVIGRDNPEEILDFNTIKMILVQKRKRYNHLILTGGEPTLRNDFFYILDLAYKLGYTLMLQTNGRIFSSKDFCERVSKYNIDFSININGPTAKIHDATTQSPGSFEQAIEGIKNLQKTDSNILIKIILTKSNYKHLFETAQFLVNQGITNIWFVFLTPYGLAKDNFDTVVPTFSEVSPTLTKALHWLKKKTNTKISLEGFPHCCLNPEFHTLITETEFTEDSLDGLIPDNNGLIYNCKRERVLKQKQKFPECSTCFFNKKCEGIYNEYINKIGRAEFLPIEHTINSPYKKELLS